LLGGACCIGIISGDGGMVDDEYREAVLYITLRARDTVLYQERESMRFGDKVSLTRRQAVLPESPRPTTIHDWKRAIIWLGSRPKSSSHYVWYNVYSQIRTSIPAADSFNNP
jgi:hypothetical protein